jgi:hypothetical protein
MRDGGERLAGECFGDASDVAGDGGAGRGEEREHARRADADTRLAEQGEGFVEDALEKGSVEEFESRSHGHIISRAGA